MTPFETIQATYAAKFPGHEFERELAWHLHHGFVFSTPDFFVMGSRQTMLDGQGCWFVHAMAGDIAKAWDILPYPLPFIAFERVRGGEKELQVLPIDRIRRLSHLSRHVVHPEPIAS